MWRVVNIDVVYESYKGGSQITKKSIITYNSNTPIKWVKLSKIIGASLVSAISKISLKSKLLKQELFFTVI